MPASPNRPKIDPQEALKWLAALRRAVGLAGPAHP